MKTDPAVGLLGFSIGLVLLLLYAHQSFVESSPVSFVALTIAWWLTEYYGVNRQPSDFSCGFIFALILALQGEAAGALIVMIGAFFIRQLNGRASYPWDLTWSVPPLLLLAIGQAGSPEPQREGLAIGVSAILGSALLSYAGSKALERGLRKRSGTWREVSIEREQRRLRSLIVPFAAVALVLDPDQIGIAALAAPLFLAIQFGAKNVGFRVEAQSAVLMAEEADQSRRDLAKVQGRLTRVSEKQKLLEDLVQVFDQSLTPSQAFRELHIATRSAVPYRSIVLFRITGGTLQPVRQSTPEKDLLAKATLTLKKEPLAEKAWVQDRPFRGKASSDREERLLPLEQHLVAIPLKPFGVLYYGRSEDAPFGKVEASKLLFITQRAQGALTRAEESAQSKQALAQQTQRSEALQKRVALTSRLLQASGDIMLAASEEEVLQALKDAMQCSVSQHIGWVKLLSASKSKAELHWGEDELSLPEIGQLFSQVREARRPLYLGALRETRYYSLDQGLESVLLAPLLTGDEIYGVIAIAAPETNAFSKEVHDFVCTLACLAAGGLESLGLTLELKQAHDQVVQASKLSAIGQLAAGVAHELNTPLAAIGLALESAAIRPEGAAQTLLSAEKALERAQEIVKGLLEHARQKDSDRELVAVSALFEELQETLGPPLQNRGQELKTEILSEGLSLLANHSELLRVLSNLVLNASDASPKGALVRVCAQREDNLVSIQVEDRGCGVPDEAKARLFEPFFTTKRVGKGTGLGLSVCRELVHRHRGEISFQSRADKGTVFSVKFPARLSQRRSILGSKHQ